MGNWKLSIQLCSLSDLRILPIVDSRISNNSLLLIANLFTLLNSQSLAQSSRQPLHG